jgi:hypothetical protein
MERRPSCRRAVFPAAPALSTLKNQARALQRQVRAADPQATAPQCANSTLVSPSLPAFTRAGRLLALRSAAGHCPPVRLRLMEQAAPACRGRHPARRLTQGASPYIRAHRRPHRPRPGPGPALPGSRPPVPRRPPAAAGRRTPRPDHRRGLAFRRYGPGDQGATLRDVAVLPPHHGKGIERRLVEKIEQAAASLEVSRINLSGATGDERDFYLARGSSGRHAGGLFSQQLPRPPPAPSW